MALVTKVSVVLTIGSSKYRKSVVSYSSLNQNQKYLRDSIQSFFLYFDFIKFTAYENRIGMCTCIVPCWKRKNCSLWLNLCWIEFLTVKLFSLHVCEFFFQNAWFSDLYQWQIAQSDRKSTFVLHDGPPYANAVPNVGHTLNKVFSGVWFYFNANISMIRESSGSYKEGQSDNYLYELKKKASDSCIELPLLAVCQALRSNSWW